MEKFKTNLLSCFASFMEFSEHLDRMDSIKITNPADTLYNIGHKVGLPEKLIKEAYEEFDQEYPFSCKGTNIYIKLFDELLYITKAAHTRDFSRELAALNLRPKDSSHNNHRIYVCKHKFYMV